jgi:uncharacterized protein YyaL (SSP411 family)
MRLQSVGLGLIGMLAGAVVWSSWPGPPATRQNDDPPPHRENRLARETSPYLLQHARNPVDWYPWGPEAFERARAVDRPIFLSVGYSACHWCHVMERESFEDEEIARYLNEHFICIKVDREERPDVDQLYMAAVQAFQGRGGWPMSVFLTPDGRPFYGGTYYPARDRDGIEGFEGLLRRVVEAWRDHRPRLEHDADAVARHVRRATAATAEARRAPLSRSMIADGVARLADQFDPQFGGFGFDPTAPDRPKFPEAAKLLFFLEQQAREPGRSVLLVRPDAALPSPRMMVEATLDHLRRGGIRDQIGGGYHRYSVDRAWVVPHFEKMLYDNALLALVYLRAFELDGDPRWRREAEDIFAFVAREMTGPEGGFHSALDAEADGREGEPYAWSRAEIAAVLTDPEDLKIVSHVYGLNEPPNFEGDRYVLLMPQGLPESAKALSMAPEALEKRLATLRATLLEARRARPQPALDDKILTAWNGLMIAAYAEGYRVLKDEAYRQAAGRAADFLLARLRDGDGRLLRTYRDGRAKLPAYLDDYAALIFGLLRLHAATGDPDRQAQARALADRMIADFADEAGGGFFFTAGDHEALLARPKDPYDNAMPSGNALAVLALIDLAGLTGETGYLGIAGRALDAFSPALARTPTGVPTLLVALGRYLDARPDADEGRAAPAAATIDDPLGLGTNRALVTAEAAVDPMARIVPGAAFHVILTLKIADGWHLYANPAGAPNVKPTVVELAANRDLELVSVNYPAGARKVLGGATEPLAVYEGRLTIQARVRVADDAPRGPLAATLRMRYQACDDRACLAPAVLDVPLRVEVTGP